MATWPIPGKPIGQRFRALSTPKRKRHLGIDIPVKTGTPIKSPWPGQARVYRESTAAGCLLQLRHDEGAGPFFSEWLHLRAFAVSPGEDVTEGQVIAESDDTGTASTGPHSHLQVLVGAAWLEAHPALVENRDYVRTKLGVYVNPLLLLPPPPARLAVEDAEDVTAADVVAALRGLGELGAKPPIYRLKAWCRWQGGQFAGRVLVTAGLVAIAAGLVGKRPS